MKAVFHIGTPKSGTTTIQTFLALNRDALCAQGFRYEQFNPRNAAQLEFAMAGMIRAGETVETPVKQWALGAYGNAAQTALFNRLDASLRNGVKSWSEHTYIASSEQIGSWLSKPARIGALDAWLRDVFDDVRYILYLRPQHELVLSSYSERIKRGEALSFEDHFAERLSKMNWLRLVNRWTRVVGEDRLTVRLLDRTEMANGDLLDDFCTVAGLDRGPLQTPPRMNTSLSVEEIEQYLRLSRYLSGRTRRGAPNRVFNILLRLMRLRLPEKGTSLRLEPSQVEAIRAEYLESNERLRARFFPQRSRLFSTL